ncbi:phospholipid/glycerol acyltransferase [Lucifera butyrica]|uniref:1-acyl-sn-glycerol-3-phosphate acyltransferase n=1 Tax=Lucifera butyrica TaxID=1351585 RepID=A0A498R9A4_9FIRM|nr:lysophospholipid acyltransferase family protein [Lucifera butyrica]VBB07961.1 phospholipid/glycerol acyltransferase [Lucifera butyrica]
MYEIVRTFLRLIFRVFFRWEITGRENIPAEGGVIIAANHVSLFDPPVLGCAISKRRIHFMAKEELFAIPIFGWLITKFHAFPVRRGVADRTAIRTTISLLEQGEVVGVFPEGTRSKTGMLGKAEPGVAMIASKVGATVVPAALTGTNKVFRDGFIFSRFTVKFGEPIKVDKAKADKETLDALSRKIMDEIAILLK